MTEEVDREDKWLYFNMLLVTFGLYMQIYATLPFSGCLLLKATGNFSSNSPPTLHLSILQFTRSSTHSNVHEGVRLEENWIRSPEIAQSSAERAWIQKERYLLSNASVASHLSRLPGDNQPLGEGKTGGNTSAQGKLYETTRGANLVSLHPVHMKWGFFLWYNQAAGVTWEMNIAGKGKLRAPHSS